MQRSLLFSVPLTQAQLVVGELYYKWVLDRDIQASPDHITIKDYSPQSEGFSSEKLYSLKHWLPEFFSHLIQEKHLVVSYREYFSGIYGTYTINLQSPQFSQLRVTIDKGMVLAIDDSAHGRLDILSVPCKQFKGVEAKVLSIIGKKLNLDFKSAKDWRTLTKNISHIRVDLTITSNYQDADEVLLKEVEAACSEYIYSFYKGVLLMADKWMGRTTNQMLDDKLQLYNSFRMAGSSMAKRGPSKDQLFGHVINNYNELVDHTSFSKLVERRTSTGLFVDQINVVAAQSLGRSSLGGTVSLPANHISASSKIINGSPFKRGQIYLKVLGYFSDSWEERLGLLDGRVFYYSEDSNEEGKLKEAFPLEGSIVEEFTDPARAHSFKLVGREGKPSLILSGLNRFDNEEWINLMRLCSSMAARNPLGSIEPIGEFASSPTAPTPVSTKEPLRLRSGAEAESGAQKLTELEAKGKTAGSQPTHIDSERSSLRINALTRSSKEVSSMLAVLADGSFSLQSVNNGVRVFSKPNPERTAKAKLLANKRGSAAKLLKYKGQVEKVLKDKRLATLAGVALLLLLWFFLVHLQFFITMGFTIFLLSGGLIAASQFGVLPAVVKDKVQSILQLKAPAKELIDERPYWFFVDKV